MRGALLLATALSAVISTQALAQSASCSAPVSGAITPGIGSFSVLGDPFSINPDAANTATIDGQPITPNGESSQTSQMVVVNDQVYGQDKNTLQWFQLMPGPGGDRPWAWQPVSALPTGNQAPVATTRWASAQPCTAPATTTQTPSSSPALTTITPPAATVPAGQAVTPPPAATPDWVNANSKCGTFTDANGKIIGPNGQPFISNGVDIWAQQVTNSDPDALANQITSMFPGVNMIRIAAGDGYGVDSAAALEPFVLTMTAKGIVVEIGDYNPQYTQSVPWSEPLN